MHPAPLRLVPRLSPRVWGDWRLARAFGRDLPPDTPVGESWEVYGELPVASGPYAGRTLDDLTAAEGEALVGRSHRPGHGFPLLVKWLDCNDWLSIQVHPDDPLARRLTGDPAARGKSECWYVVEADDHAEMILGLEEGVSPEHLDRTDGRDLLPLLGRVRPRAGQVLFIPAGTIHSLGPGLLLLEVQQSSDLTYRLYDWDRPGLDGRPRDLHREQALQAARAAPLPSQPPPGDAAGRLEACCPYFVVEVLEGPARWSSGGRSFDILAQVEGSARLRAGGVEEILKAGDVVVVPACAPAVEVEPTGTVVRARVP